MKRILGLAVLAVVTTAMMAFGAGCDSDDEGDDGQYCAYEVGIYEECDIRFKTQAPRQEVCTEFLAACGSYPVTGCVHLGGRSICTKNCSKYNADCPNGGTCDTDAGYCVP